MDCSLDSEEELEERLSRPSEADVTAMAALDGDILILGAGGKMGPSLARLALRAARESGIHRRVIAVARFTNGHLADQLRSQGVETIAADLLEPGVLARLPDAANVIFMAARKFGTRGSEYLTWALNTYLPGLAAERYRASRIVAFSTGNVYPLMPVEEGGATEQTAVSPVGEYAQSALGRERMFEYASDRWQTPVTILRLNYAIDLRYGVLLDIATAVYERRPVNLSMGFVNVIWQGDANSMCLRSFAYCSLSATGGQPDRPGSAGGAASGGRVWTPVRDRSNSGWPGGGIRFVEQRVQGSATFRESAGFPGTNAGLDGGVGAAGWNHTPQAHPF